MPNSIISLSLKWFSTTHLLPFYHTTFSFETELMKICTETIYRRQIPKMIISVFDGIQSIAGKEKHVGCHH